MKRVLAFGSAIVLCATLSSCGGDDKGDGGGSGSGSGGSAASYCDQISDIKDNFEDIDFSALSDSTFEDMRNAFSNLQAAAPEDVKDEWATMGDTFDKFQKALDDAGISLDDLQALSDDPNSLPEDLDLNALQQLGTEMTSIAEDSNLEEATDTIAEEVKDECDIDLNEDVPSDGDAS